MIARGTLLKLIAGLVLLVGVGAGAFAYQFGSGFENPTVRSVDSEFGAVTDDTSEIVSTVVVHNPNDRAIPAAAQVTYEVRMNDVAMADGSQGGFALEPGRNAFELRSALDNGKIPAWWVSHVNNGEWTRLTITPGISFAGLPLGADLPSQNRTITTDLLGAFTDGEPREVALNNRSILVVSNQSARWGEATRARTPMVVTTAVENTHDRPVTLDGTVYEVRMNGIVVGNGTTDDALSLQPGESDAFTVRAAIDSQRMQAWWTSHLRRNETTRISVEVYGMVEKDGERQRVPVTVFERESVLRSDFLGEDDVTVESVDDGPADAALESPELVASESRWGEVRDRTTAVETHLTIGNPNGGEVGDLLSLDLRQRTAINGVEVSDGRTTVPSLEPGNTTAHLSSEFHHSTVPHWWAHHLNAGEESSVVTRTNATVDLGVTAIDAAIPARERTLTTDLLANFTGSEDRPIEQDGRRVATVTETSATWGQATPDQAPIDAAVTIRNEQPRTITVRDATYTVMLNDVVLAENRTADASTTIAPYATATFEPTFLLDNSRMAQWWPTHVRGGETSTLNTEVTVTIETAFGSERVRLDGFSGNQTVTTDVLS